MSESFKEPDLLGQIGRFAREQEDVDRDRFDDRLERLCKGELSADEHEQLLAEVERSEELRRDYETFKPLGEDFQRKILDQFPQSRAGTDEDPLPEPVESSESKAATGGKVLRPAWWSRRSVVLPLAATLLAVLGGLWIRQIMTPIPFEETGLATYRMEILGGRNSVRSSQPQQQQPRMELPTFAVGDRIELTLKPELDSGAQPEVKVFVVSGTGTVSPLLVKKTLDERTGVFEIEGVLEPELDLEPGEYRLAVLYGQPGELPDHPSSEELTDGDGDGPWRVVEAGFLILPPEWSATGELPLEVEFAGCFAVGPGPTCVPYNELTIWARSYPRAELSVFLDGESVEETSKHDGGSRFVVPDVIDAKILEVRASYSVWESRYEIALTRSNLPEWLKEARELGFQGQREEALAELNKQEEIGAVTPELSGAVLSLKARLIGDEGERDELLAEALIAHCEQQNWLQRAYDLGMLVDGQLRRREYDEARSYLAPEVCPGSDLPAEAQVLAAYSLGILHSDTGDYRGALDAFQDAVDQASRLGLEAEEVKVQLQTAVTLQRIGRATEAAELLRGLVDQGFGPSVPQCVRTRVHNHLAWAQLHLPLEAGLGDPLVELDQADEIASSSNCGDELALDLAINRALALEREGRIGEALAALGEARDLEGAASSFHKLWLWDIEGRVFLREGRPLDASYSYSEMEVEALAAKDLHGQWRAVVQQGTAREALDENDKAAQAYDRAEDLLADRRLQIPLDAGREAFFLQREKGTARYVDVLLRLGRVEKAVEVARRSRARVLSSLRLGHRLSRLLSKEQLEWDLAVSEYRRFRSLIESEETASSAQREAWNRESMAALDRAFAIAIPEASKTAEDSMPADDAEPLSSPDADELVLVYHPLPEGWVGFALQSEGSKFHRFELPEGMSDSLPKELSAGEKQELSSLLLAPFSAELGAKQRARVLAYGVLQSLDFHALPWGQDVLLASHSVVYGLDLGVSEDQKQALDQALVVAGPGLTTAQEEAEVARQALSNHLGELTLLSGSEVRTERIFERMQGADWLHFVGHGQAGGPFGWDSSIELADDERLTAGDILSLRNSPSRVVIASCQGAEVSEVSAAGFGLAQAFVIAGSQQVVASARDVRDDLSLELMTELYKQRDIVADLGNGLRRAQLAVRETLPHSDWAAFRALVP